MNGQFDLIERQIIVIERYSERFVEEVVVLFEQFCYNFNEFKESVLST